MLEKRDNGYWTSTWANFEGLESGEMVCHPLFFFTQEERNIFFEDFEVNFTEQAQGVTDLGNHT